MSNVAGKASALTVITPQHYGWLKRWIFNLTRLAGELRPLKGLQMIHFAQWYVVPAAAWSRQKSEQRTKQDQLIFLSHFNGTWDQYIDAFSDGVPFGVNLLWLASGSFPGSVPLTPFKHYIRHNTIDSDYFYSATPGAAQRDIKSALKLAKQICELSRCHSTMSETEFTLEFRHRLKDAHLLLAASGNSPPPSNETETARRERWNYVEKIYARLSSQLDEARSSTSGRL